MSGTSDNPLFGASVVVQESDSKIEVIPIKSDTVVVAPPPQATPSPTSSTPAPPTSTQASPASPAPSPAVVAVSSPPPASSPAKTPTKKANLVVETSSRNRSQSEIVPAKGDQGSTAADETVPTESGPATPGTRERRNSDGGTYVHLSHDKTRGEAIDLNYGGSVKIELQNYHHGALARTTAAYIGKGENELSFIAGRLVTNVMPTTTPGFSEGTVDGASGLIPTDMLRMYDHATTSTNASIADSSSSSSKIKESMEKHNVNVPIDTTDERPKNLRAPVKWGGHKWAMTDPVLTGGLNVKGGLSGGWSKRYGVLDHQGYMYVYKAQKDKEPYATYDLALSNVCEVDNKKRAFCFDIAFEGKSHHYSADSEQEQKLWVDLCQKLTAKYILLVASQQSARPASTAQEDESEEEEESPALQAALYRIRALEGELALLLVKSREVHALNERLVAALNAATGSDAASKAIIDTAPAVPPPSPGGKSGGAAPVPSSAD